MFHSTIGTYLRRKAFTWMAFAYPVSCWTKVEHKKEVKGEKKEERLAPTFFPSPACPKELFPQQNNRGIRSAFGYIPPLFLPTLKAQGMHIVVSSPRARRTMAKKFPFSGVSSCCLLSSSMYWEPSTVLIASPSLASPAGERAEGEAPGLRGDVVAVDAEDCEVQGKWPQGTSCKE